MVDFSPTNPELNKIKKLREKRKQIEEELKAIQEKRKELTKTEEEIRSLEDAAIIEKIQEQDEEEELELIKEEEEKKKELLKELEELEKEQISLEEELNKSEESISKTEEIVKEVKAKSSEKDDIAYRIGQLTYKSEWDDEDVKEYEQIKEAVEHNIHDPTKSYKSSQDEALEDIDTASRMLKNMGYKRSEMGLNKSYER